MKKSFIPVSDQTKERLENFGKINQSYDVLLTEILDHLDTCDRWWENK